MGTLTGIKTNDVWKGSQRSLNRNFIHKGITVVADYIGSFQVLRKSSDRGIELDYQDDLLQRSASGSPILSFGPFHCIK